MGIKFFKWKPFDAYKLRYILGYGLIGLALIGVLVYAGLYAPGGISEAEQQSIIKSAEIQKDNFGSYAVIDLPFHLLQKLSMFLFGVSTFSVKLPSLILALASAFGLVILLGKWFKRNVAVLSSIIAITTGQFILIAQSGTPEILYIFWSVYLLLFATLIARRSGSPTIWKIALFATAALSLYTPLSFYVLLAMIVTVLLHPHLRFILRSLSKARLAIAAVVALALVSPMIYGVINSPELGLRLLGVPTTSPDFVNNFSLVYQQYLGFASPSITALMTPVFGLASMIIIGIGFWQTIKTRATGKSYLILIWLLCLIPLILVNPAFTSVAFLPLVLLLASGIASLLRYWYQLFPHNPYARIAGLVPVTILVGSLVFSGLDRYMNGYLYDPATTSNFSQDLSLIPKQDRNLVVHGSELRFYYVVAKYNKSIQVSDKPSGERFIATKKANKNFTGYSLQEIITSPKKDSADRFYVYKKTGK